MRRVRRSTLFWLASNALGITGYVYYCSQLWADEPGAIGMAPDGNSAISWFFTAFPFLAACALINVVLLGVALYRLIRVRDWMPILILAAVLAGWFLADRYVEHHVTVLT